MERKHVSINPEEIIKLEQIEEKRPDIKGYTVSKKVHVALQEWFRENFKNSGNFRETKPLLSNGFINFVVV